MARILREAAKVRTKTEKPFLLPLFKRTIPSKGGKCSGLLSLCCCDLAIPQSSECPATWLEFLASWCTLVSTFRVARCLKHDRDACLRQVVLQLPPLIWLYEAGRTYHCSTSSCLCLWDLEAIVFPSWQILSPLFLPVATGSIAFASSLGAEKRSKRNLLFVC